MTSKKIFDAVLPTTLLTAIGFIAGAVANGLRLHIGHDAEMYIGMLYNVARGEWGTISFVWPPGFPLLGLPFVWAGFAPDMSLFTVQLLSFATIIVLTWFLMAETGGRIPLRTGLFLALALSPVMHSVMYDFRSELPFAAFILILAHLPWPWEYATRALLVALLITALFLLRYVGLAFVAFPAAAWFLVRPRQSDLGRMTILATLAASLLIVLYVAGVSDAPVAGYAKAGYDANMNIVTHVSDFGLSVLGVIGNHAHKYLQGPQRIVAGLALLALLTGALTTGIRSKHPKVAILALAAAIYAVAIIAMRCVFWFDPLSGPRFAIPVLPAVMVAVGSVNIKRRWLLNVLLVGIGILVALQIIQLAR